MTSTEQSRLIGNLIFLSYRRSDTATDALALRLELQTQLRNAQVFLDTHTIQSGDAWPHQIDDALRVAKVVIPVIGKSWAGGEPVGQRRIDDPKDWVHKELAAALAQKRSAVMPVLVDGAQPLRRADLPEPLQDLADIQPFKIDLDQWDHDVQSLLKVLKERYGFESKVKNFKYPDPDPMKWKTMAVPWEVLETEVAQRLANWRVEISDDVDNMHYKRVELTRDFEFETFEKAMEFMQAVAKHCSDIDHHPRWMNLWRTVTVWLSTWDAGRRVTALDIQLAQYLERKYKDFK
jgi:pterin-4a-carbinolamine dehydratase